MLQQMKFSENNSFNYQAEELFFPAVNSQEFTLPEKFIELNRFTNILRLQEIYCVVDVGSDSP